MAAGNTKEKIAQILCLVIPFRHFDLILETVYSALARVSK